jgi:hypothetical protein
MALRDCLRRWFARRLTDRASAAATSQNALDPTFVRIEVVSCMRLLGRAPRLMHNCNSQFGVTRRRTQTGLQRMMRVITVHFS